MSCISAPHVGAAALRLADTRPCSSGVIRLADAAVFLSSDPIGQIGAFTAARSHCLCVCGAGWLDSGEM